MAVGFSSLSPATKKTNPTHREHCERGTQGEGSGRGVREIDMSCVRFQQEEVEGCSILQCRVVTIDHLLGSRCLSFECTGVNKLNTIVDGYVTDSNE